MTSKTRNTAWHGEELTRHKLTVVLLVLISCKGHGEGRCVPAVLPEQCHPAVGLHKWCSHTIIIPHQLFTCLSAQSSSQALSWQLYLEQKYSLNPTFGVSFCLSSPSFLTGVAVGLL